MRNEETMYQLILDIANKDDNILAVYMNGSRTNPNVPKDIFQDYDIVYVVKETKRFIEDRDWIKQFGTILYMQYPDENPFYPSDPEHSYGWLMQFADGNRVDLTVKTLDCAREDVLADRLCKILLDKAQVLPDIPESTDEDHWVKAPAEAQFQAVCNEFWWCTNNLVKGLWREEITYVQDMSNFVVRKQLETMLSWKIGILTEFHVSIGKSGKYMKNYLAKEEYEQYLATYFDGNISHAWESVLCMCTLFEQTARYVAEHLHYKYLAEEGKAARDFLEHVRALPKDAQEVYG